MEVGFLLVEVEVGGLLVEVGVRGRGSRLFSGPWPFPGLCCPLVAGGGRARPPEFLRPRPSFLWLLGEGAETGRGEGGGGGGGAGGALPGVRTRGSLAASCLQRGRVRPFPSQTRRLLRSDRVGPRRLHSRPRCLEPPLQPRGLELPPWSAPCRSPAGPPCSLGLPGLLFAHIVSVWRAHMHIYAHTYTHIYLGTLHT